MAVIEIQLAKENTRINMIPGGVLKGVLHNVSVREVAVNTMDDAMFVGGNFSTTTSQEFIRLYTEFEITLCLLQEEENYYLDCKGSEDLSPITLIPGAGWIVEPFLMSLDRRISSPHSHCLESEAVLLCDEIFSTEDGAAVYLMKKRMLAA